MKIAYLVAAMMLGAFIMFAILKFPIPILASNAKVKAHPLCKTNAPSVIWTNNQNFDTTDITLTYGDQITHTDKFTPCREYIAYFVNRNQEIERFTEAFSVFFAVELPETGKFATDYNFSDVKTNIKGKDISFMQPEQLQKAQIPENFNYTHVIQYEKVPPIAFRINHYKDHLSIVILAKKALEVIRSSSTPISSNKTGTHPLCGFDTPGKGWSDAFDDPDTTEMTLTYGYQIKHTKTFKPCHEWRAFFTTEKERETFYYDTGYALQVFKESLDTGKVLEDNSNQTKTEFVYTTTRVMQFEKTPPAVFKVETYSDHYSLIVLEPQ